MRARSSLSLLAGAAAAGVAAWRLVRGRGGEAAKLLPESVASRLPGGGGDETLPGPASGATGEGIASDTARGDLGPRLATPPVETPGPSITPPQQPESDVERAERADELTREPDVPRDRDPLVVSQEAAAAAEAAAIGGAVPADNEDPALDPVYQAGGGDQEGFEAAEADLIDAAENRDRGVDPSKAGFGPEAEADKSTAVYGEGNRLISTEVVEDPDTPADDPGQGPGLGAERGPGLQPRPEPLQDPDKL